MMRWVLVVLGVFGTAIWAEEAPKLGSIQGYTLLDLANQKHTWKEDATSKGVVFVFLGTECPVSNGFTPEYKRLAQWCSDQKVRFYGVHADPDVSQEMAQNHAKEYGIEFPILMDPKQQLAQQAEIKRVPTAVVVRPDGTILYRGRINDRYSDTGKRRDEPTSHDLQNAIEALLAGKVPAPCETKVFGCPLPTKK